MAELSQEQTLRAVALREANVFLTWRTRPTTTSEGPRLPDVADVTGRMEHYLRTGEFPLEADWRPPPRPAPGANGQGIPRVGWGN